MEDISSIMNKIPETKKALRSQSREFSNGEKTAPALYVGSWTPLGAKQEEIWLCNTDSGGLLLHLCEEPLRSANGISESLDIDSVERYRILAETKVLLGKHSMSSGGTIRCNVRDPIDFCLSICDDDTDVFLRIFGMQGSSESQLLRKSVFGFLRNKFD